MNYTTRQRQRWRSWPAPFEQGDTSGVGWPRLHAVGRELGIDARNGPADLVDEADFEGLRVGLAARRRQRRQVGFEAIAAVGEGRDPLTFDGESPGQ